MSNDRNLEQPRGPGTAWRFRMSTPKVLKGTTDPETGKTFGRNIIRSLGGVKHKATARKLRDVELSKVRELELQALGRNRYSLAAADRWAEAMADPDPEAAILARGVFYDEVGRAPSAVRDAFGKRGMAKSKPLAEMVEAYIEARAPGNAAGYEPLRGSTINDFRTAVRYLVDYLGQPIENHYVDDVGEVDAETFREFLGDLVSERTARPLAGATIQKYMTQLRTFWKWCVSRKKTTHKKATPFTLDDSLTREAATPTRKRAMYAPDQTRALFAARSEQTPVGAMVRLGLLLGARISELVRLNVQDVDEDRGGFKIVVGKTNNATRWIPIPTELQPMVSQLCADAGTNGRLLGAFSLDKRTGNSKQASQAYSRLRDEVIGKPEGDILLDFHSLRHTWRTFAHRAGVSDSDAEQLGGWAKDERRSSEIYNHGLGRDELREVQRRIVDRMKSDGYLKGL
ncbi:Phage integrase family protein [Ruegeria halocynthiae]|uniref:Phage integrase family protein n=1 Tax=Ruegeria halocynthiae TaxID=985054 RepID=A0A1H3B4G5_9RHOB|nr:tyrosine-type recombinase/integrase [Ruegeria halocynthiae]SDX36837.1 Phage integrase family protein [Ruegeria halocynthiae]